MVNNLFYFILIFIILETIHFDVLKASKNKYASFYILTWWLLSLVAIFKYGIGPDTPNYMVAYEYMPPLQNFNYSTFEDFRFNPLCTLFFSFCKTISKSYLILQMLQGFLFFYSFNKVLKYCNLRRFYILLFFFLYTYFMSGLTAVRESLAVSFTNFALIFFFEKRWKKYFLFTLIALGFHSGAIITFILPLLNLFNPQKIKRNILYFTLFFLFASYLIVNFKNEISLLLMFGDGSVGRYIEYAGESEKNIYAFIRNGIILIFIITMNFTPYNKFEKYMILMGIFYLMIDILSSSILPISFRILVYFNIPFMCIIKYTLNNIKKNNIVKIIIFIFFVYYQPSARFIYNMTVLNKIGESGFNPYCSVISNDKSYYDKFIKRANASDYYIGK